MALPNGVSACTVTFGPYLDQAGRPLQGSVTFVPSSDLTFNGAQLLRGPVVVKLANGLGSVVLPHTDQEGMTAGGFEVINWTYTAVIRFKSEVPGAMDIRPFSFSLPQELGDTWDLDTAVPIESVPGELIPTLVTAAQLAEAVAPAVSAAQSALSAANAVANALPTKVDKVPGKVLSDNNYSTADKSKLGGISDGATVNAPDSQLRDRGTHTGTQAISTVAGLQALLDSKVVSVSGKGLSTNDYTTADKDAVAGLPAALGGKAPVTSTYLPAPSGGDDTSAIQAVINSVPSGGSLVVGDRYRVNGQLNITTPMTLHITARGELYSTGGTTAQVMVNVSSSNVHIRGEGKITGPQFAAGANQTLVQFLGASGTAPLTDVSVRGITMTKSGKYAIFAQYVKGFAFNANAVKDVCYGGVMVLSGVNGSIDGNTVQNITQTGYSNSYGIATTRAEVVLSAADPRSENISICGNRLVDIPLWDGINTHGGAMHTISNNVCINVKKPIELVACQGGASELYAPLDMTVTGNVITSTVTGGTMSAGIMLVGADGGNTGGFGVGNAYEYATGTISGNVIRGHGTQSSSINGAILAYMTKGVTITGNTIIEPSPVGINLYHTNVGFVVQGNTITDPWTSSGLTCSAINASSTYNSGYIAGNNLQLNGKTAAFVAHRGISVTSNATNSVVLGTNDMAAAGTPVYDPGSRTRADTHRPATDRIVYVSTSGTDSNSGRALGLPFLTVEAAIASFGATNGGTVMIAAGTYSVGELTVRSGRSIIGAGRNATVLNYTGTGTAITSSIPGTRTYGVRLDGFTLQTSTGAVGIDLASISNAAIYECNVNGFSDACVRLSSSINGGCVYNNLYGVTAIGTGSTGSSIAFDVPGSGSNSNTFHGCSGRSSAYGLKIVNSNHVTWIGGTIEANAVGVSVESTTSSLSDNFIINSARFEGNTVANWKIGDTSGTNVRSPWILFPALVTSPGGDVEGADRMHKFTNNGIKDASAAVASAAGTWRFERTANGGTEMPAFVVSDPVTSTGTPVTIQAETGRTTGYPFRAVRAGTTYWDVDAAGNTRQPAGSYHEMKERASDPVSPAADNLRLYARDNGSGATQMAVKFPSGAVSVLATDGVAQLTQSGIDTQLATKVDKVTGKGLSTEDYTTAEKTKLAGAAVLSGATFTGAVVVPTPTASGHAATKAYVDSAAVGDPGSFVPGDYGLLACDIDPMLSSTSFTSTAGVVYVRKLKMAVTAAVSSIRMYVNALGATVADSYWALYDAAGNQLGVTADVSSVYTSTGTKTLNLVTPTASLPAGTVVYVVYVIGSAGTMPTLRGFPQSQHTFGVTTASQYRWANFGTGQTTLPSSLTISSLGATSGAAPMVGLI